MTKITDPNHVSPTFVNQVIGRGALNGVVNLTFAVANFMPNENGIDTDMVVSCRLRMDLACAQQLRDELTALLDAVLNPQPEIKANGHIAATSESVN